MSEWHYPKDALNDLRGVVRADEPMAKHVWFGAGGAADLFFMPEDITDLQSFLSKKPAEMPLTVIGIGSNLLVRDGGIRGAVICMSRKFTQLDYSDNDGFISAGAGVPDVHLAKFSAEQSCEGMAFYAGIPGTVGGAIIMNAGAHGSDTSEHLQEVDIVHEDGTLQTLSADALNYSYRHSELPSNSIVVTARFKVKKGDMEIAKANILDIQRKRRDTQPVGVRTGGSTFKNPENNSAWRLIDGAGLRGYHVGDAMMSEKHCNFMINQGKASGADLENLGEYIREKVFNHAGITLEWEIKRLGQQK